MDANNDTENGMDNFNAWDVVMAAGIGKVEILEIEADPKAMVWVRLVSDIDQDLFVPRSDLSAIA